MDIENVMAKGLETESIVAKGLETESIVAKGLSDNDENQTNGIIRSIGYVSLCVSLFLFLTIKIMKYLLARKKFKFRVENSQNNTPNSLTPVLKRSYTP